MLERVLKEFTEMKMLMRQQSEESQRKINELQGKFEGGREKWKIHYTSNKVSESEYFSFKNWKLAKF